MNTDLEASATAQIRSVADAHPRDVRRVQKRAGRLRRRRRLTTSAMFAGLFAVAGWAATQSVTDEADPIVDTGNVATDQLPDRMELDEVRLACLDLFGPIPEDVPQMVPAEDAELVVLPPVEFDLGYVAIFDDTAIFGCEAVFDGDAPVSLTSTAVGSPRARPPASADDINVEFVNGHSRSGVAGEWSIIGRAGQNVTGVVVVHDGVEWTARLDANGWWIVQLLAEGGRYDTPPDFSETVTRWERRDGTSATGFVRDLNR